MKRAISYLSCLAAILIFGACSLHPGIGVERAALSRSVGPNMAGPVSSYWTSDTNMRYTLSTQGGGSARYAANLVHSPPYSIELQTAGSSDKADIVFSNGPQLNDINALSYWTYTRSTSYGDLYGGLLRPYLAIYLDVSPDTTLGEWNNEMRSGTGGAYYLQAEPAYSDITGLTLGTWEKWDAFADQKPLRWVSNESPDLPYYAPTLTDYQNGAATNFPTQYFGDQAFASREYGTLYVVAIKVRAGYGAPWANFDGFVDDVAIGNYTESFGPAAVAVDVKPGSEHNSINLRSHGNVPVAVLGASNFDVSTVDPTSVSFAGAPAQRWAFEDVNRDGVDDLVLHFDTQSLGLDSTSTQATLTGWTVDAVPISGTNSVTIVRNKNR